MTPGEVVAKFFATGVAQRKCISLECGLQNGTLAVVVTTQLFSDIVLAGGSTMFTGYGDRLLKEIKSLAQASQCAVCIYIYLYICHILLLFYTLY